MTGSTRQKFTRTMPDGRAERNPKPVLACMGWPFAVCRGMVAFSLFPGDSVVLIALLGLFVATFAGSMLGGMRVGMFLAATLIALVAAPFLEGFSAFINLAEAVGFDYPVWRLMVPRVLAFLVCLVLLMAICEPLHKQILIHYKYKKRDNDAYFETWEYLNAVWGLALGVLTGVIYLVGFFALVYVPGYLLIQVQTSTGNASKDPLGHQVARRIFADMHTLGLNHTAAWFAPASPKYYQAADTIGFIYQNHALTNNYEFDRFHWRVKEYPGLGDALKYGPFRKLLFSTNSNTNRVLVGLQKNVNFTAISHVKDVRLLVLAACARTDDNATQFAEALSKIDLKDYQEFMRTGNSPKSREATGEAFVTGRWQVDIPETVRLFTQRDQYREGVEHFQKDLEDFLHRVALLPIPTADGKVDLRHDFTLFFSVNHKADVTGRFFPRQMITRTPAGEGRPAIYKFTPGPSNPKPGVLASGDWQTGNNEGKFIINLTWPGNLKVEVEREDRKLHVTFPSANKDTYVFRRYDY